MKLTVADRAIQLREWIDTGEARRLRERAKISQALAAADCEVSQGAVLRWETGARFPRGRNMTAYHRFLTKCAASAT